VPYQSGFDELPLVKLTRANEPSFFNQPKPTLDPRLFDDVEIKPYVRQTILKLVEDFFGSRYSGADRWSTVWLAGSAASYQWREADDLDLDVLIGINMDKFRQDNQQFRGASEQQIADVINGQLRTILAPHTAHWNGGFEVTFYVNPGGEDIRDLRPYAAYNLTNGIWTVPPSKLRPDWNEVRAFPSVWRSAVQRDTSMANMLVEQYNQALSSYQKISNPAQRQNLSTNLRRVLSEASMLFEGIHSDRGSSFSPMGGGYHGFANYRWQSGKRTGAIQALRQLHDVHRGVQLREMFPDEIGLSARDALTLASLRGTPYVDQERYRSEVLRQQ
jgi:hypothetical protein